MNPNRGTKEERRSIVGPPEAVWLVYEAENHARELYRSLQREGVLRSTGSLTPPQGRPTRTHTLSAAIWKDRDDLTMLEVAGALKAFLDGGQTVEKAIDSVKRGRPEEREAQKKRARRYVREGRKLLSRLQTLRHTRHLGRGEISDAVGEHFVHTIIDTIMRWLTTEAAPYVDKRTRIYKMAARMTGTPRSTPLKEQLRAMSLSRQEGYVSVPRIRKIKSRRGVRYTVWLDDFGPIPVRQVKAPLIVLSE